MSRKRWLSLKLILLIGLFITLSIISIKAIRPSRSIGYESIKEGEKQTYANVDKIRIDSINLDIDIYESDVSQVTIQDNSTLIGKGVKKPNKIAYKDGTLSFEQVKQKTFLKSFLHLVKGNVLVQIPKGTVIKYDIDSISGNINHDALSKENLKLDTISGEINVYQGAEKISADSISGSINLSTNEDTNKVVVSTISGSTKIRLDKVTGYTMDYSTVSSNVKDTYLQTNYSRSGTAKSGDESLKIDISSVSGSISLTDWD